MAAVRPYFPELGELRSALVEIEYRALSVEQLLEGTPLAKRQRRHVLTELAEIRAAASAQNEIATREMAEVVERLDRIQAVLDAEKQALEAGLGIESRARLTLVATDEEV